MKDGGLSILYEDGHLMAADKPAGIHTAPLAAGGETTLLDMILKRFPETAKLPGIRPVEPGLLHRLDKETSGVVVAARTGEAFERLRRDFSGGRAVKEYIAVSSMRTGEKDVPEGGVLRIQSRFEAYGPGRKTVRVVPMSGEGGKVARAASKAAHGALKAAHGARGAVYETEAVIEKTQGGLALIRVRIRKGFRHQIRAHLAFLGFPIIGDPLYGAPVPAGAPQRMYLHALSVELPHPATGELLRIASPLPPEFEALMHREPDPA
jgi:23S rRNA pseudouridine1911/1915/1917 synthase